MRRRRRRHWLLPIALWASLVGHDVPAQTSSLPPPIEEQPAASPLVRQSPLGAASDLFGRTMPPAPEPIPGPAGVGLAVGGMDAVVPEGLPINLAAAMQLSGVRPLDIAAAMAQVQQALALQLQAKALWIPSLNGGVDYFRHDGVQQDIFTGPNFWPQLRTHTAAYTRWDLSAKQELPYGFRIYGDINNLNSANDVSVITASGVAVPQSQQTYGLTADLGVRWTY